jgi:hypothetical protein
MRSFYYILLLSFCFIYTCRNNNSDSGGPPQVLQIYKDTSATSFFRRTSGWIAGDGAYSIPLRNQQILWLFGDSYIDNFDVVTQTVPCLFQVNNAGILNTAPGWNSATTLLGNQTGIKSYFKLFSDASGKKFWPGDGYLYGDTVYVYLEEIQLTGAGSFGFTATGQNYIAKIKYPEMTVSSYSLLPAMDSVFFGIGIIRDDASNWMYAYGSKNRGLGSDVFLARFDAALPWRNWQFWNGSGWSINQGDKKTVASGYSNSVDVTRVKKKYLLLSSTFSVGCDQGHEVHSMVADVPQGPFTNDKILFDISDNLQGHVPFFYFPKSHPEYINSNNELLITYCINGYAPCLTDCVNNRRNPDTYRPRAIRVPLALIDDRLR